MDGRARERDVAQAKSEAAKAIEQAIQERHEAVKAAEQQAADKLQELLAAPRNSRMSRPAPLAFSKGAQEAAERAREAAEKVRCLISKSNKHALLSLHSTKLVIKHRAMYLDRATKCAIHVTGSCSFEPEGLLAE